MEDKTQLSELYSKLIKDQFNFMGKGKFHLKKIHSAVKKRYPGLCDDNYLCRECCTSGNVDLEWHHRVRAALGRLKDLGRNVKKGSGHGFWIIGL